MLRANVREAKAKLSAYLNMVEQGEEILILKRGKPIAILKPVEKPGTLTSMKELRDKISLKGEPASKTVLRMREDYRY